MGHHQVGVYGNGRGELASADLALACSRLPLFALNPAGHHLDSVLIHALNAVLLFLLLVWVTKRAGTEPAGGRAVRRASDQC